MQHRAFRYRLKPTPDQAQTLSQWAGACRFIYNLAWEQRETWGRAHRSIGYFSQSAELTALRAECDWLAAAPQAPLAAALRDLDSAYGAFFSGRASRPLPRKRGDGDGLRFRARETHVRPVNRKWAMIHIPKLGAVLFRLTRPLAGRALTTSVRCVGGEWFVSVVCEMDAQTGAAPAATIGADRGVANAVTLSTGEAFVLPERVAVLERRRRRAQKTLARRCRGSKRYARQRRRVSRLSSKGAAIRRDFNHRASRAIARQAGVVVLEDLNVKGMTAAGRRAQKRGLNRSILAQGWRQFEVFLGYKLAERGGHLIKVNPAYTSQTCSACGAVDARSRESQARFVCVECGHRDHADVNAAKNILRRSTALLDVEGGHRSPREASTELAA